MLGPGTGSIQPDMDFRHMNRRMSLAFAGVCPEILADRVVAGSRSKGDCRVPQESVPVGTQDGCRPEAGPARGGLTLWGLQQDTQAKRSLEGALYPFCRWLQSSKLPPPRRKTPLRVGATDSGSVRSFLYYRQEPACQED